MLVLRRAPENIASVELQLRSSFNLSPTHAFRDNQRLTQRMGMPCSTGTRFKVNHGPTHPRGRLPLELTRNSRLASEILSGPRHRLQFVFTLDFHLNRSLVVDAVRCLRTRNGQRKRSCKCQRTEDPTETSHISFGK